MANDISEAARLMGEKGGKAGGVARTPKKRKAAAKNLKKARAARWPKQTA